MRRVLTLVTVVLLAQAVNDGQSRRPAPGPTAVQVDRHIDAHIEPEPGTPAASPGEGASPGTLPPPPAIGTTAPDPTPPEWQLYRDRLYRDRR